MFFIDKHNKILLTKGDTASILIAVKTTEGNEYKIADDDVITMTVKKSGALNPSIVKTANSDHYIVFDPVDTSSLTPGLYIYDVQLQTGTGAIYTIIPKSYFELGEEVS